MTIETRGIRISPALHQRIKVHAALQDKSIGQYLEEIVPPLPEARSPARKRKR